MALIMAKDGKILTRATGGVLATDCSGPTFNCSTPKIVGCRGCSCCCARYYLVCISGAPGDCSVSGGAGGVSYSIKPTQPWWPDRFRVTISGANRCATTCTASTYSNFYYRVNSVSIDGVYDVDLDEIDVGDCIWRVLGVGSYSYSVWNNSDCSGSPLRTITGKFNIMVQINGSAQLSCTIRQDSSQHAVPGDEFSGFVTLPADAACTSLSQALADTDTRCPLAWGYWDSSYVRTFNGATVTVSVP